MKKLYVATMALAIALAAVPALAEYDGTALSAGKTVNIGKGLSHMKAIASQQHGWSDYNWTRFQAGFVLKSLDSQKAIVRSWQADFERYPELNPALRAHNNFYHPLQYSNHRNDPGYAHGRGFSVHNGMLGGVLMPGPLVAVDVDAINATLLSGAPITSDMIKVYNVPVGHLYHAQTVIYPTFGDAWVAFKHAVGLAD
jgi:hypothetical protein